MPPLAPVTTMVCVEEDFTVRNAPRWGEVGLAAESGPRGLATGSADRPDVNGRNGSSRFDQPLERSDHGLAVRGAEMPQQVGQ